MRRDVVAECGADRDRCDPDTLDLSLEIRLDDAWFSAGAERMERAQLVAMTGRATTGDAGLVRRPHHRAAAGPGRRSRWSKAQLQAAYLAGGSLPVRAAGSLTLSMADVRR